MVLVCSYQVCLWQSAVNHTLLTDNVMMTHNACLLVKWTQKRRLRERIIEF